MSDPELTIYYDIQIANEPGEVPSIRLTTAVVGMEAMDVSLQLTHVIDALMMAACNAAKLLNHDPQQFLANVAEALPSYWSFGEDEPVVDPAKFIHPAPETKN